MPTGNGITYRQATRSFLDLRNLYEKRSLNLEPGFQRQSVWTLRDRTQLIDSILRNYPLPAIFLYRRQEQGNLVYDVIDGKQRLESVFRFVGAVRQGRFEARVQLPGSEEVVSASWNLLKRKNLQHLLDGYDVPVIEVDGEMGEIIDIFIRINSTGKALTQQEKRHARYYNSAFLKTAGRLATRFETYFRENKVFSAGQISRMKHVELICELMLSLIQGDVLNKKTALDRVMAAASVDDKQARSAAKMAMTSLNRVRRMFPLLKTTRLRQVTDFYTLVVLIGKFEREGLILTNTRRNALAWDLLETFATRVDKMRLPHGEESVAAGSRNELYQEYLQTVLQATDEIGQRRRREKILDSLLRSLFSSRDTQRGFSPEQRRILWNTTANRVCKYPGCGKRLSWDDFTIDHIDPHSKGGRTKLNNAALMCRMHNATKGNRTTR